MKALKLTALLLACTFAASAQVGLQAGWNLNNYQYKINGVQQGRSSTPGFNGGIFYRLPLGRHGHAVIEPSLLYTRKGAMNTNTAFPIDYYRTRLDYIQFSLPFMYRAYIDRGMDFTIGGGPFAGVLANADVITRYQNGDQIKGEYAVGTGNPNDFKPMDGGLRFVAGLRFARVINLSAAYDLGLADIAPQANTEIRTRTFSLNLGLMLW